MTNRITNERRLLSAKLVLDIFGEPCLYLCVGEAIADFISYFLKDIMDRGTSLMARSR